MSTSLLLQIGKWKTILKNNISHQPKKTSLGVTAPSKYVHIHEIYIYARTHTLYPYYQVEIMFYDLYSVYAFFLIFICPMF